MHSALTTTTAILSLLAATSATPNPIARSSAPISARDGNVHIPLNIHDKRQYSDDLGTRQEWLKQQGTGLRRKYASRLGLEGKRQLKRDAEMEVREALAKRASGDTTLVDVGTDASYSGQVTVGTPSQNFYLIFDTGSADMWVAGTDCTSSSCRSTSRFDTTASSTYSATGESFSITYGSGAAAGTEGTDTVTIAGFTISNQEFGVVNQTSANVIGYPLSGILGLAFETIAQTRATPFWEAVMTSGQVTEQTMGFFMKRYRGDNDASMIESDGGQFTLGALDTSLYTGDINYVDIASNAQDYWRIPTQAVTINGNLISGVTNRESAIDTGTTLIGAPSSDVKAIYAQIQGAEEMDASTGYSGYWQYPCNTVVNATLQYGGLAYAISNADFNLGPFTRDSSMCTGAFFEMDLGSASPIDWIVGASFLKNVYSVFRYEPLSIGFAQLSGSAQSVSNGTNIGGTSTSGGGTTGSGSGTGSGTGSGSSGSGAGRGATYAIGAVGLAVGSAVLAALI